MLLLSLFTLCTLLLPSTFGKAMYPSVSLWSVVFCLNGLSQSKCLCVLFSDCEFRLSLNFCLQPFFCMIFGISVINWERCLLPTGPGRETLLAWQGLVTTSVPNRIVFPGFIFVPESSPDMLFAGEWITTFLVDLLQWMRVQWCTVAVCWIHTCTDPWQAFSFESFLLCRTELQASYSLWQSEHVLLQG